MSKLVVSAIVRVAAIRVEVPMNQPIRKAPKDKSWILSFLDASQVLREHGGEAERIQPPIRKRVPAKAKARARRGKNQLSA